MKILITGNMGYIGPRVVEHLHNTIPTCQLVGCDNGFFSACLTNATVLPENLLACQYFSDVRCITPEILKGVSTIIHLAAISNDPMGKMYEGVTLEINHLASVRLAAMAKQSGVKSFIIASSCSVYGYSCDGVCTEQSKVNPLTNYARSKVFAERDLMELASADFMVTCLRFATACGMSPRLRLDLVLNDFVASAISSNCIKILSDGTPWRPLIDVRDMARAFEWAVNRNLADGGAYLIVNVGANDSNHKVIELANAVRSRFSNVDVLVNSDAAPDNRSYKVDFSLYQQLAPAYQPIHSLIQTIDSLSEGLRAISFCDENFRNSHLIRLSVINKLKQSGFLDENLYWSL